MSKWAKILIAVLIIAIVGTAAHLYWLSGLSGDEVYPQDTFLDQVSNKTALVIVAHDDDAIGCAGTISELTRKGWVVHFLTFYGNHRKEDNPVRKNEVMQVAKIQRLASITLLDFPIQKSDTVQEPWMPIPYSQFSTYMQVDSLKIIIEDAINQYRPSVLFTLDNVIGGYGNPEHVCVSQCALDVSMGNKNSSVERIYQAVFTRTLNENVLRNYPVFIAAKKVYQASGSPIPVVEVDILGSAKEKMEVMRAYKSQERNLKKIWPYYNVYPYWIYFNIFDKEYFNILETGNGKKM